MNKTERFTRAVPDIRMSIIEMANAKHTQFPQYEGKWNGYKLCRVKRTIRTKLGLAFVRNEISIGQDATVGLLPEYAKEVAGCVAVYSKRNGIDTFVHSKDIEWLE